METGIRSHIRENPCSHLTIQRTITAPVKNPTLSYVEIQQG